MTVSFVKKRQYALEQVGYGEYDTFVAPFNNQDKRFVMKTGQYVYDQVQVLPEYTDSSGTLRKYSINNIKKSLKTVNFNKSWSFQ